MALQSDIDQQAGVRQREKYTAPGSLRFGFIGCDRVTDQIETCYSMAMSASVVDSAPEESDQKKKP